MSLPQRSGRICGRKWFWLLRSKCGLVVSSRKSATALVAATAAVRSRGTMLEDGARPYLLERKMSVGYIRMTGIIIYRCRSQILSFDCIQTSNSSLEAWYLISVIRRSRAPLSFPQKQLFSAAIRSCRQIPSIVIPPAVLILRSPWYVPGLYPTSSHVIANQLTNLQPTASERVRPSPPTTPITPN